MSEHRQETPADELEEAQARVRQLEEALHSLVVIEQAKGVLRERFGWTIEESFAILHYAARTSRMRIHDLAARVVAAEKTPPPITVALARSSRWRAAHARERAEAQRERAAELDAEVRAQQERLAPSTGETRASSDRQQPPRHRHLEAVRSPAVREVRREGDAVCVVLRGELDAYSRDELREVLEQECARKPARLLVDLSRVSFIDSTVLHLLVATREMLPNWRGLVLASPTPPVRRTLEIVGADRLLTIA